MASWDAQKKEGKHFAYFVAHRDFEPGRTLAKTAQILGLTESYVRQIAGQWNWNERADQWDAHLDVIARRAYVTELEKQARQRAQAYNALMGKSLEALKNAPQARLGEIATAMKVASEGMRLEAGLATERAEISGPDGGPIPVLVQDSLMKAYGNSERDPEPATVGVG